MKVLLAYWTDRDLQPVLYELNKIPCDQIHIKYFSYPQPHIIAEDYFRAHPEYTHLILVPNDLVFTESNYRDLLFLQESKDYQVVCGVANVDLDKNYAYWNVTSNLPELDYRKRRYYWISRNRYPDMLIQVPFAGFPGMMVSRDVLEQTRINWLSEQMKGKNPAIWEERGGYSNDLAFAYNLRELGIEINCHTGIEMLHLRYFGESQLGIKDAIVEVKNKPSAIPVYEP